ncbi:hypothetical protein FKP32DRAFT_1242984 [Trametes sanguinea]|nr:hypothetical protein FKP32DRAFT_1242984 [Trametes sanguinea]
MQLTSPGRRLDTPPTHPFGSSGRLSRSCVPRVPSSARLPFRGPVHSPPRSRPAPTAELATPPRRSCECCIRGPRWEDACAERAAGWGRVPRSARLVPREAQWGLEKAGHFAASSGRTQIGLPLGARRFGHTALVLPSPRTSHLAPCSVRSLRLVGADATTLGLPKIS